MLVSQACTPVRRPARIEYMALLARSSNRLRRTLYALLGIVGFAFTRTPTANAQESQLTLLADSWRNQIKLSKTSVRTGYRAALVLGNEDYSFLPLRHPVSDAASIAEVLRERDFDAVRLETNLILRDMQGAAKRFVNLVRDKGGLALVYFAGYGFEYKGENYLAPVDFEEQYLDTVPKHAFCLGDFLRDLARVNSANVIILDASRASQFSASQVGFSDIHTPVGTIVVSAAQPGRVVVDSSGSNSVFTAALLPNLRQRGLEIRDIVGLTRDAVAGATRDAQIPWSASLLPDVIFLERVSDRRKQMIKFDAPRVSGTAYVGASPVGFLPADVLMWPGTYELSWLPDIDDSSAFRSESIVVRNQAGLQTVILSAGDTDSWWVWILRQLGFAVKGATVESAAGAAEVARPDWVTRGGGAFSGDPSAIYAVGSSGVHSRNLPFVGLIACLRSIIQLQYTFEGYTAYLEKFPKDISVRAELGFERKVRGFASGSLSGVQCVDEWIDPISATRFSLARVDLDGIGPDAPGASAVGVADVLRYRQTNHQKSAELNAIGKALVLVAIQHEVMVSSLLQDYGAAVARQKASFQHESMTELVSKIAFDVQVGPVGTCLRVRGNVKEYLSSVRTSLGGDIAEFQDVLFDHEVGYTAINGDPRTLRFSQGLWVGSDDTLELTLSDLREALTRAGVVVENVRIAEPIRGAPQIRVSLAGSFERRSRLKRN